MPAKQGRKLVATMFMSLDGVIEDPHKWSFPFWNDEIAKFKQEELFASDAMLLGRVTYEAFAAAWPGRKDPEGYADRFNSMPKHVVSKTQNKAEWNNSHLIKGDVAKEIAKLKQRPGRDILIHGSRTLIHSLMKHDLIDRFNLLVYPLILGRGKRLFTEGKKSELKLVESKAFGTGVVALVCER